MAARGFAPRRRDTLATYMRRPKRSPVGRARGEDKHWECREVPFPAECIMRTEDGCPAAVLTGDLWQYIASMLHACDILSLSEACRELDFLLADNDEFWDSMLHSMADVSIKALVAARPGVKYVCGCASYSVEETFKKHLYPYRTYGRYTLDADRGTFNGKPKEPKRPGIACPCHTLETLFWARTFCVDRLKFRPHCSSREAYFLLAPHIAAASVYVLGKRSEVRLPPCAC